MNHTKDKKYDLLLFFFGKDFRGNMPMLLPYTAKIFVIELYFTSTHQSYKVYIVNT